jgi:hypothetical protein
MATAMIKATIRNHWNVFGTSGKHVGTIRKLPAKKGWLVKIDGLEVEHAATKSEAWEYTWKHAIPM